MWSYYNEDDSFEIDHTQHFIEMDYTDTFPLDKIHKNEKVVIVDFHIQDENVFKQLQELTKDIVLIDHHKTTVKELHDKPELFKDIRYVIQEGKSGCYLTWKHFCPDAKVPQAIELISDYDTWTYDYAATERFVYGMKLFAHQPWNDIWQVLLLNDHPKVNEIINMGLTCIRFRDNICSDYTSSYGWETTFEGYNCFANGIYMFGSLVFGDKMDEYDICLSYEYLGDKWIVGLYSKTIDVSEIAVRHGGGGHKFASGFTCNKLPFSKPL